MRLIMVFCAILPLVFVVTCGKKKDDPAPGQPGGTGTLNLGKPDIVMVALGSLPSITEPGSFNPGTLALAVGGLRVFSHSPLFESQEEPLPVVDEPVNSPSIQTLFQFECFMDNFDENRKHYCPPALVQKIKANPGDRTHAFSNHSLLGMLAHAGSPSLDVKEYESYSNASTEILSADATSPKFVSTRDLEGNTIPERDADAWVVAIPGAVQKAVRATYATNASVGLTVFNADPVKDGFAAVVRVRKQPHSTSKINDLAQTYLGLTANATPRVLAYNQVLFNDSMGNCSACNRAILLINFANNRFLLKQSGGPSAKVVMGQGGFDFESYSWKEGAYFAKSRWQGPLTSEWGACVDNKRQVVLGVEAATSACGEDVQMFFDGQGDFDAGEFLDLDDTERIRLAGFLAFFSTPDYLTSMQVPSLMEGVSDLPDTIR